MKVDRGVKFYNEGRIGFDLPFLLSRLGFVALGLDRGGLQPAALRPDAAGGRERFARRRRKRRGGRSRRERRAGPRRLRALGMRTTAPGAPAGHARGRPRGVPGADQLRRALPLRPHHPAAGLQHSSSNVGAFEAPLLITPGFAAARMMNTLTLLVCLLLLFYTVESLVRDQATGLSSISYASPVRSASILFGKALANSFVGRRRPRGGLRRVPRSEILVQGKVPFSLTPFLLVWGLLLLPTFLLWTSFASALFSVTRNRYVTYALALGRSSLHRVTSSSADKMNWVGNWDLWDAVRWSDMGPLELDRTALVLNRLLALSLAVLFVAMAVRFFPRTSKDATLILRRLEPAPLLRGLLSPRAVPSGAAGSRHRAWVSRSTRGFREEPREKKAKDYWRQNLATWKDAPLPDLTAVELKLELEPRRSCFRTEGSYRLVNRREKPIAQVALTGDLHWENVKWTLDGKAYKPEDRTAPLRLHPSRAARPGSGDHRGVLLRRASSPRASPRTAAGSEEFILPSGVVLTSFSPSFTPVVGYHGGDRGGQGEPLRAQGLPRRLLQGGDGAALRHRLVRSRRRSRSPCPTSTPRTRSGSSPARHGGGRETDVDLAKRPAACASSTSSRGSGP